MSCLYQGIGLGGFLSSKSQGVNIHRILIIRLLTLPAFVPVAADKSHGRIIWDCAWAAEGYTFATASRDKTVSNSKIQKTMGTSRTFMHRLKSGQEEIPAAGKQQRQLRQTSQRPLLNFPQLHLVGKWFFTSCAIRMLIPLTGNC
jgi:hypothetical protein